MPTALRTVRVADDLWRRVLAVAQRRNESVSHVIRAALERYLEQYE